MVFWHLPSEAWPTQLAEIKQRMNITSQNSAHQPRILVLAGLSSRLLLSMMMMMMMLLLWHLINCRSWRLECIPLTQCSVVMFAHQGAWTITSAVLTITSWTRRKTRLPNSHATKNMSKNLMMFHTKLYRMLSRKPSRISTDTWIRWMQKAIDGTSITTLHGQNLISFALLLDGKNWYWCRWRDSRCE